MRKKQDTKVLNQKVNFPVFTIDGSKLLNSHASIAIELQLAIQDLSGELTKIQNQLNKVGKKLNIYVNNIIKLPRPFDFKYNLIHITKNNELYILSHNKIQQIMKINKCSSLEEVIEKMNLPTKNKYTLNYKQAKRCMDIVENYNLLWQDYDFNSLQLDSYIEQYNLLLEDVKDMLSNICIYEIDKKYDNIIIESYNENNHEILITKDYETEKWKWVYVRKEDTNKVLKIINKYKDKILDEFKS